MHKYTKGRSNKFSVNMGTSIWNWFLNWRNLIGHIESQTQNIFHAFVHSFKPTVKVENGVRSEFSMEPHKGSFSVVDHQLFFVSHPLS